MENNIFWILGVVYIVSLFTFRWMIKKDVERGRYPPLTFALFLALIPLLNTCAIIAWIIDDINVDKIAEKFFK